MTFTRRPRIVVAKNRDKRNAKIYKLLVLSDKGQVLQNSDKRAQRRIHDGWKS